MTKEEKVELYKIMKAQTDNCFKRAKKTGNYDDTHEIDVARKVLKVISSSKNDK
jgi:hypothetical protein